MVEQFKYINHLNETLEFGNGKIFVNESDLHDFAWKVKSSNDRISGFSKGIVTKSIPIILKCNSIEEGIALKNQLFEIFEKDILAVKHGRIVLGDYYMQCYVTESKKNDYLISDNYIKITVKISTDFPQWTKETKFVFGYSEATGAAELDYNRDFPYDYMSNMIGVSVNNTGFAATDFIMNIYGPCDNPCVTIAGHDYEVACSALANEYLTINSKEKTIILTKTDGEKQNLFNKRNRDSYIFEKIPSGISSTSRSNAFKFDVTLLEERGEPKWI